MRQSINPATRGLRPRLRSAETSAIHKLRRISLPLLRLAIGIVFLWFGALKIANMTPVGDFVGNTLPWFDRDFVVPALGWFEVFLGLALIAGRMLSLVCAALVAHLCGTFLALVMQPSVTFQDGNPLVLTTEGEFVVKNLVLIAAALVIAARFHMQDISVEEADELAVAEARSLVVPQAVTEPGTNNSR
ncbi:MAG TPA: DoxX family membrane protein [Actinophytocola sp.]|uniref:DoxX family protein n=1 Tax=Actinophytocola sp. TaxID=1872138 RepID=UPI002DBBD3C5|nr:DoxX family membrane protein [Actinophytocola sp.]HEU5475068.1 DoxX family membrane protein [Actinophytocola sp.]